MKDVGGTILCPFYSLGTFLLHDNNVRYGFNIKLTALNALTAVRHPYLVLLFTLNLEETTKEKSDGYPVHWSVSTELWYETIRIEQLVNY